MPTWKQWDTNVRTRNNKKFDDGNNNKFNNDDDSNNKFNDNNNNFNITRRVSSKFSKGLDDELLLELHPQHRTNLHLEQHQPQIQQEQQNSRDQHQRRYHRRRQLMDRKSRHRDPDTIEVGWSSGMTITITLKFTKFTILGTGIKF
jgi:hypothetical protein